MENPIYNSNSNCSFEEWLEKQPQDIQASIIEDLVYQSFADDPY